MPRTALRQLITAVTAAAAALALMTAAAAVPARADDKDLARALAAIAAVALIAKLADDNGRKHGHHPRRPRLPEACAIDGKLGRHWTRGYVRNCLTRAGLRDLPADCRSVLRVRGRDVPVFDEICLIRAGYRPE